MFCDTILHTSDRTEFDCKKPLTRGKMNFAFRTWFTRIYSIECTQCFNLDIPSNVDEQPAAGWININPTHALSHTHCIYSFFLLFIHENEFFCFRLFFPFVWFFSLFVIFNSFFLVFFSQVFELIFHGMKIEIHHFPLMRMLFTRAPHIHASKKLFAFSQRIKRLLW